MPGFTHLHVHSEYSLLDGLARVPDLVKAAKARGFEALALTDHGVMFGAVQFYQAAMKQGIKPIIGCELYVARRTRFDREAEDRKPFHLTVLAQNAVGYRNLLQLVSRAQLEGFYYRPRVDRELLAQYNEGLIVFSGCPGADAPSKIIDGRVDAARDSLAWYKEVFGDRFFIELQNHDIEFIPRLNTELLRFSKELDIPLVATNDVHYATENDPRTHEVLLCIQTGTTMSDPKRMKIGDSFYLRTEAEMRALFPDQPEAISNTARIAEMCDVSFTFNEYKLPRFPVPDGQTAAAFLRRLCEAGACDRYGAASPEALPAPVRARLDYELSVIGQMGFDDYFLIVWDLCRYARQEGVWWNVRGSGAGAIVSYTLKITNLDPLHHQLIFERFLNPSRISMPDIDLDFPDDQRDQLIRYTFQKYGHDRVAQIITFGTMGARAAIRDAGRALGMELATVDRIAKLVPALPGKPCSIDDALRPPTEEAPSEFYTPELRGVYDTEEEATQLIDTARSLEGVTRHASTHAAGVVISDRPLTEYLPLARPTRDSGPAGGEDITQILPVTQFNMGDVELLGLLKVDFLGLATLTVLRRAAEMIERYHGKRYTLDDIPLDDPGIYQLLTSGDVTGVFQVEGAGMRKMLREMRPHRFEHVVAAIALYRPGPMEYIPTYIARLHGREKVSYRHPSLEPILAETYGIIVYQEQIIQIARDLAGYNAGEADTIRKAVGKKLKEKLLEHRQTFIDGAVAGAIPAAAAGGIFDDIETFARYGFNKAHAADYALIVCQTAYLKAHYPVEYMAALLMVERGNVEKVGLVTADCRRMGIALLAPSVNHSEMDFTIETLDAAEEARQTALGQPPQRRRGIRFGLAAVKNVGEGPVAPIVSARATGGPFASLDDLAQRVDLRAVGKRALESLIKAGALDAFGKRGQLMAVLDKLTGYSGSHHLAAQAGQMSLFGADQPLAVASVLGQLPNVAENPREDLAAEKELIGLYISDHPLQRLADAVNDAVTTLIGEIEAPMNGQPVTIAGMVTDLRVIMTKKGQPMAFAKLEDLQGAIEVTVFPRTYAETKDLWRPDAILQIAGKVEAREDRVQVIADLVREFDPEVRLRTAPGMAEAAPADPPAVDPDRDDAPLDAPQAEEDIATWGDLAGEDDLSPFQQGAGPVPSAAAPTMTSPTRSPTTRPPTTPPSAAAMIPPPIAMPPATPRPAPPPAPPDGEAERSSAPYRLTVQVPRSADHQADIKLLGQVYQLLISYSGQDRFSLRVKNGAGMVDLDFPNNQTRYCVALMKALDGLLGRGRVEVAAPQVPVAPPRGPGAWRSGA